MKKTIKADQRILAIVDMVPKSQTVADIGCDHGKTSVLLLKQGKAKKVIATDISAPSLNKAKRLVKQFGYSDQFDFRWGDGLTVLKKGEADTIVISGIGGELMERLLAEGEDQRSDHTRLVLAPNNRTYAVRQWLNNHRFVLTDERLVHESGKFYQIMVAEFGLPQPLSPVELAFGRQILNNGGVEIINLLEYEIRQIEAALVSIRKSKHADNKKNALENKLIIYQETLKWLKNQKS